MIKIFNSLRVQVGIAFLVLFTVMTGAMGYTIYALQLRNHDYLILNLTGQLRVASQDMLEQARHYAGQAPDDYQKYDRDLETYWPGLQKQVNLYDRIIRSLETRQIAPELTGQAEVIRCNFDAPSRNQLSISVSEWKRFRSELFEKLGDNLKEPRLTWAAEYIDENGENLVKSSDRLAHALQLMMEHKLQEIQLFQYAAIITAAFLLTLLTFVLHHLIIRPLKATVKGFERVARGDFQQKIPVLTHNEIGHMTVAFNSLTERLNSMFRLTDRINQGLKLDEMLKCVHEEFQHFVPFDWIGVFYPTPDGASLTLERLFSTSTTSLREGSRFDATTGLLSATIKMVRPMAIRLDRDPQSAPLEYSLATNGFNAAVYLPLLNQRQSQAVMVFASKHQTYTQEHVEFLANVATMVSQVLEKTLVMENLVIAAVQGLAKLAESRDPETGDHLTRMSLYAALITEELGHQGPYAQQVSPAYIREVFHFAPMHDIGKVGIRDDVLLKPGKLDPEERREMERHPTIGGEVLRRSEAQLKALGYSMFRVGIEIAECHHEKYDGTGYPAGLQAQAIPLSARIVAAADVFDALTSRRPYKEAWSVEKALEMVQENAGKHFDPIVIEAMLRALPKMMDVYQRLKHV